MGSASLIVGICLAAGLQTPAHASTLVRPFTLFGWSAPPVERMDDLRVAEYAAAGLDLMLPSITDSGRVADNLDRLAWAAAHGVRCLLWDRRFAEPEPASPGMIGRLDSIAATYRDTPAFAGYYLGDEPPDSLFDLLGDLFAEMHARDPAHPCWNNLLPRSAFATRAEWLDYTQRYIERVDPSVLSNAQYDLLLDRDSGFLVENVAGMAAIARAHGLPFWGIVQVIGHGSLRSVSAGELAWQVGTWLSHGARGIGYFVYWEHPTDSVFFWGPGMIARSGERTIQYERVRALNQIVHPVGEALALLRWRSTQHAGSIPRGGTAFLPDAELRGVEGRAAIGRFDDAAGTLHVFVLNSDSLRGQEVVLSLDPCRWATLVAGSELPGPRPVSHDGGDARVPLLLGPGEFTLLRIERAADPPCAPVLLPSLEAVPNPAAGSVRFRVEADGPTSLEIVSPAGRVLWRMQRPADGPDPEWRGETQAGVAAPTGVYLVRLVGANGTVSRRIVWLGVP